MDNVVSIYTGETPCEFLFMDNKNYLINALEKNNHIEDCDDCKKRYQQYLRYAQTAIVEMFSDSFIEE